jgi:glycosyltransferase involved in cell wall biosynthesis
VGHREVLNYEVARLKLGRKVTIENAVFGKEKDQLFRSVDALVLPSHSENYGAVVAEALAYGRPVIASRGTPWAVLAQEECGWWVNSDRDSLVSALKCLGNATPAELQAMGARGRTFVQRSLTWARCGAVYAQLYRDVLRADARRS